MRLTTQIHVMPTLRISGATPLRPLCAFMACAGSVNLTFITLQCTNFKLFITLERAPNFVAQLVCQAMKHVDCLTDLHVVLAICPVRWGFQWNLFVMLLNEEGGGGVWQMC